jgi:hypothetical protein
MIKADCAKPPMRPCGQVVAARRRHRMSTDRAPLKRPRALATVARVKLRRRLREVEAVRLL